MGGPELEQQDPDIRAFCMAHPDDADARLRQLAERASAVVAGVIGRRLRETRDRQESEDIRHDVLLRLMHRLRQERELPGDEPIVDLLSYAAVMAEHACYAYLRRRHPGRARLKNRIRYVLLRQPEFRLTGGDGGRLVAARGEWPASAPFGTERARAIHVAGTAARVAALDGHDPASVTLPLLVDAVLRECRGPVEVDDLVAAVAAILGVDDGPEDEHGSGDVATESLPERLVDRARLIPELLGDREYLAAAWVEIQALPLRQRVALLLNLRDAEGRDLTSLMPLLGVATFEQMATCLEMSPAALAAVWAELPIDDLRLADRLGISRQQVINLRKSARERLARRLRRWSS